jgi:uncharacterized protein YdeI (YjbR/CyaY-like superfamily)
MGTRDPRIDAYIEKSAPFARPILTQLRSVVHEGCPEVEETIKWGAPFFDYRGTLCSMAAFKEHCAFGFWKASLVLDDKNAKAQEAAGHFGRIRSLSDLPPKQTLIGYIKKAMALNEHAVKPSRPPKHPKKPIKVPAYFRAALEKNKKALATFESFPPSHKRDYVEWVTTAKGDETRERRLATAVEWMSEGKPRNWKYMKERSAR